MRRIALLLAAVSSFACGGGGGKGNTVNNPAPGGGLTVTGTLPLSAANFAAVSGGATCPLAGQSYGVAFAALIASDQGGICGYLQQNQDKASARSIDVAVIRIDTGNPTAAILPGTYPIVVNPTTETTYAFASVVQNDASCNPSQVQAASGVVDVASVASDRIQGTVNVLLSDGGQVTGSFDAATCAVTFPGDLCAGELGPQNPSCAP